MPEDTRTALIRSLCKALFESRYPGVTYAESLVRNSKQSKAVRLEVDRVLSAIEALGLHVVDLNLYTPKRRLRMSRAGPRMRAQGKMKQEVRNTPQRLAQQVTRRKRN